MWVRNFDTHQTVVVADMGDSFTDYFTEMFGTLVWRPLADLPEQRSNYGRADYDAQLAGATRSRHCPARVRHVGSDGLDQPRRGGASRHLSDHGHDLVRPRDRRDFSAFLSGPSPALRLVDVAEVGTGRRPHARPEAAAAAGGAGRFNAVQKLLTAQGAPLESLRSGLASPHNRAIYSSYA